MLCGSGADADPTPPPRRASQCAGHGSCVYGFCKCDGGWYGHDCSRKVAGQEMEPGGWRAGPLARWPAGPLCDALGPRALPANPQPAPRLTSMILHVPRDPPSHTRPLARLPTRPPQATRRAAAG